MDSHTGIVRIKGTNLQLSNVIRLGQSLDAGTTGQVIVSNGPNQPASWGSNSAVLPNALTMGTNVSLASGNASFDGSIADTLNATDNQLTLVEQNGIVITDLGGFNRGIATDIDGNTIVFNGTEMEVAKVPNTLTITDSAGSSVVFDGSSTQSITINDNDNQLILTEGNGITITNTGGFNRTIAMNADGTTLSDNVGSGQAGVLKVPNTLTITDSAGSSVVFDGSSTQSITINDNDTTYQGGTGISIDTATNPDTINCANIPNSALQYSTISGISLGNSLSTITFYQADGTLITSYNGANPPTSVVLDGDTTYQGGKNITVDTTTNPDTIDLDDDLVNIHSINFVGAAAAYGTELVGNNYPVFGYQTPMSYFNLTSTTNMIPGAVLATKVQRTTLIRSFSTTYGEYSSNFRTSFVAQSANVMVEFRAIVRADNKLFYGGLYDYNSSSWNTDQRNRFNYNDESDQDFTVNTWWMRNLTPGTTYYISPYFKSNSGLVYMYTGHSGTVNGYAPAVMRIIDGGNNVNVY
tara:strand:+ start:14037 stop:15611 length:1575 start_codon:yes stop_codon:yes gene_type:complete